MKNGVKYKSEEDKTSSSDNFTDAKLQQLKSLLELIRIEIKHYDLKKNDFMNQVLNKEDTMETTIQKINIFLPYAEFIKKLIKLVKS